MPILLKILLCSYLIVFQAHGMPRIMGVLTQLDRLRTQKQMRRRKKELKSRFQSEISARSSLFYFSGVSKGLYPQRETINMARFLSVIKTKVLKWRNSHPYLLADRFVYKCRHDLSIDNAPY